MERRLNKKIYGSYFNSPIGLLEVVGTEDSICEINYVAEKSSGESETNSYIEECVNQLEEYFNGGRKEFELNLQQEGTEFQKKVWKALVEIPYGVTLSYKELANKIGNEKASRAVGKANSKNIISIIIPCHRVIGADKSLTGYAGGLDRKQWLLEHESKN